MSAVNYQYVRALSQNMLRATQRAFPSVGRLGWVEQRYIWQHALQNQKIRGPLPALSAGPSTGRCTLQVAVDFGASVTSGLVARRQLGLYCGQWCAAASYIRSH